MGHTLVSDDEGDTWTLISNSSSTTGGGWPVGPEGGDENQYVELRNGSILANMRSLSTGTPQWRLQARSDDFGESWTRSRFVGGQPQPFNGCQGSVINNRGDSFSEEFDGSLPGPDSDTVFVASPDPLSADSFIQKITGELNCNVNLTGRTR